MERRPDTELLEEKKRLRRIILRERNALTQEERREKSQSILNRFLSLPCYLQAESILCYASYQSEVMTDGLLEQAAADGKKVYCPRVEGAKEKMMEFYRIDTKEDLQEGYKGIREPEAADGERRFCLEETLLKGEKACMILPGAVFDRAHHRIGYGGGYYDRYLQRSGSLLTEGLLTTAAIAYRIQVVEEVPFMAHDQSVQILVTEACCL